MPLQGRLSEWEKKIIFLVVLLLNMLIQSMSFLWNMPLLRIFATSVLSAIYDHSFMGRHLNSDDYDFVLSLMMATVTTI